MATRRAYRKQSAEDRPKVEYDPFQDFEGSALELYTSKFFYWIRQNIRHVLTGVAAVTILVIVWASYSIYQQNREDKAKAAFEELEKNPVMTPGATEDASVAVKRLEEYRQEHTTDSAQRRAYLKELELLEAGNEFELAARAASKMATSLDTPELKAYYHMRSALLFERAGKEDAALSEYEQFSSRIFNEPVLQAVALFNQGRILMKKGREQDAQAAFRQLLTIEETANIEDYRAAAAAILLNAKDSE